MKRPGEVPSNLSGTDYQAALADVDPTATVPSEDVAPPAKRARVRGADPDIDGHDVGETHANPAPIRDCDVDSGNSSSSSSSSNSSSSSSSNATNQDSDIDGGSDSSTDYPRTLYGCKLTMERHRGAGDFGLRMKCPVHANCRLFRNLKSDVPQFGEQGPVYYLGGWARLAFSMDAVRHKKHKPTRAEIRDFIASGDM